MAINAGPDVIEDGLILSLDSANINSYPKSGTTWRNQIGGTQASFINNAFS